MVITMSDYLLEYEISDVSCENIALEQCTAEIEVSQAIIEAYVKQITMLEYASDVYTEAEGEKQGFFKKIGEAIKKAWRAFVEMLKRWWSNIKRFFTGTTVAQVSKRLEKLSDEEKKAFVVKFSATEAKAVSRFESIVGAVMGFFEDMADFKSPNLEDDAEVNKLIANLNDRSKKILDYAKEASGFDHNSGEETWSYEEAMSFVKELKEGKIKKEIENLSKDFEEGLKSASAAFTTLVALDASKEDVEEANKRDAHKKANYAKISNVLNKFMAEASKLINENYREVEAMMMKLIKAAAKEAKSNAKRNANIVSQASKNAPEATSKGSYDADAWMSDPGKGQSVSDYKKSLFGASIGDEK